MRAAEKKWIQQNKKKEEKKTYWIGVPMDYEI